MANHLSTELTRFATEPVVLTDSAVHGSTVHFKQARVTVTTAMIDNADDNIILLRLDPDDRPVSVKFWNTDLDSDGAPALAVNVGCWRIPNEGRKGETPVVLDADAFASAATFLQAAADGTEVMHEDKTPHPITDRGQKMWEIAGLTAKPAYDIYIGLDVTTAAATAATGTIVVEVQYTRA